jgi:hypothetical protein
LFVSRKIFQEEKLIYHPIDGKSQWHLSSNCLWADSRVKIDNKASLQDTYFDLESLFHKILGIPSPSVGMHVKALQEYIQSQDTAKTPKDVNRVKEMMILINNMKPSSSDVAKLTQCVMFQARLCNGSLRWTNLDSDFAIIDRKEYGDNFRNMITTLNFTIEDVQICQYLFEALNLGSRYLSRMVIETTMATDKVENSKLTRKLQKRAHAFYR